MATRATQLPDLPAGLTVSWLWFRDSSGGKLLRIQDISTVIRMTVTATLVMLIVETFRIPNAFLAALYAILLARENLAATWRGGRIVVLGFVVASLYTLLV